MLADGPDWAAQLSAWSTLAAAIGTVGTLLGAVLLLRRQDALLSGQIQQLRDETRDREARLRREIDEEQGQRIRRARAIRVTWGELNANDPDRGLVQAVGEAAVADKLSPFPSRILSVDNSGDQPIHAVEIGFRDGSRPLGYVWVPSSQQLVHGSRLDVLAGGSGAVFIWPQGPGTDPEYRVVVVHFVDADGGRWTTDAARRVEGQ